MGSMTKKLKKQKQLSSYSASDMQAEYNRGFRAGRSQGIKDTIAYYTNKLEALIEVKGIGEKMAIRILSHLGYEPKPEAEEIDGFNHVPGIRKVHDEQNT